MGDPVIEASHGNSFALALCCHVLHFRCHGAQRARASHVRGHVDVDVSGGVHEAKGQAIIRSVRAVSEIVEASGDDDEFSWVNRVGELCLGIQKRAA